MAFLDNSGDIILDAVLTDTGRYRLAKGDGSFRIVKYAFGDDEINYSLYKNTNHANGAHDSGSAYYDLDILQTPVLEAFTNNTSLMKSKLISIPRNNLTHLPVIKVNNLKSNSGFHPSLTTTFVVAVDQDTEKKFDKNTSGVDTVTGVMFGARPSTPDTNFIRLDQGLDTTDISSAQSLDADLIETQYIVEIDHRLAYISSVDQGTLANVSFIDDDFVASYYFSQGTNAQIVSVHDAKNTDTDAGGSQVIAGPRGTMISFKLATTANLRTSDYLFDKIGGGTTDTVTLPTIDTDGDGTANSTVFKFIDTIVRVSGATTGYSVDVPVRFIKYNAALNA